MIQAMIPGPLRVPGTNPKTEFEAFDALATFLIRAPRATGATVVKPYAESQTKKLAKAKR